MAMLAMRTEGAVGLRPAAHVNPPQREHDDRFQRLLAEGEWDALPETVRKRFSAAHDVGQCAVYRGRTTRLRMNVAGRILVALARVIGAPLPVDLRCRDCDAVVAVTDAAGGNGQVWTRLYARKSGFPQAIHSMKKFAGPTGLEEHVVDGAVFGLGMTLTLNAAAGALYFTSADYFVRIFRWRFTAPSMLAPGRMVIGHHDIGSGRFLFTLTLTHPVLGLMVDQETVFEDMEARHG